MTRFKIGSTMQLGREVPVLIFCSVAIALDAYLMINNLRIGIFTIFAFCLAAGAAWRLGYIAGRAAERRSRNK